MQNAYCVGAIRKKRQKIKYQCILPVMIKGNRVEIICLVVPHLNCDLLIGIDTMNEWLGDLNLETGQFHVKLKGKEISMPLCHGERVTRNGQVADPGEGGEVESDRFVIKKIQIKGSPSTSRGRENYCHRCRAMRQSLRTNGETKSETTRKA